MRCYSHVMVDGNLLENIMLDRNKRRTMKMIGIAPLMSIPALASSAQYDSSDAAEQLATAGDLPAATSRSNLPLQIEILDTTSIPDNNVIICNTSDEPLLVSGFIPGHIYFNEKIMDLNEAVGKQPLTLQPGQSKVFQFKAWPVLNAGPVEYVWADHAAEKLSNDTSLITLSAFMADTSAVIYANAKQTQVA